MTAANGQTHGGNGAQIAAVDPHALRIPPNNLEAERAVLGGIMIAPAVVDDVCAVLDAGDFYREGHRHTFAAMVELARRTAPIDVLTLSDELAREGRLHDAGGLAYLAALLDEVPSASNVLHYARIVADKARLRRIIAEAQAVTAEAYSDGEDVAEFATAVAQRMEVAAAGRGADGSCVAMGDAVHDAFAHIDRMTAGAAEATRFVDTGFADVDKIIGGIQSPSFVIIGARPGMGKSSALMQIMQHVATTTRGAALVFSLEMSRLALTIRMLSSEAKIDGMKIRRGKIERDDWPELTMAASRLTQASIFIDDRQRLTPADMRATARHVARKHPLACIGIDHAGKVRVPGRWDKARDDLRVAELSGELTAMGKEFGIPVFALVQLNRECEKRGDKRPTKADLRGGGAWEEDADVIALLYRDEYYYPESEARGTAEWIIDKARDGATGVARLAFLKEFTRFENLAHGGRDGSQAPPPTDFNERAER